MKDASLTRSGTPGSFRHGSLFSGIGGFDLAAEWMSWENVFHCEFNPWCRRILHHYWPNAQSYADIKRTDFTGWRGAVDVLSGGFPCQPYSTAGKRLGKEDDRHLWPEMLRAIREIAPRWIVGENVRGLVNWSGGLVFDEVQSDLEASGYEVLSFLLPACGVNAPHKRYRIWFVAYARSKHSPLSVQQRRQEAFKNIDANRQDEGGAASYTNDRCRSRYAIQARGTESQELHGLSRATAHADNAQAWDKFPTQSPVCGRDDGLPCELDGITFPHWRNASIKAYGNAVVPQVVLQIFKSIEAHERLS